MTHQKQNIVLFIVSIILATVIMLPRLLSPQFGLFDDGAMLNEVRGILNGNYQLAHDLQAGRFRPFYWLYFSIIFSFFGANPFWFFFGHYIILVLLVFVFGLVLKTKNFSNIETLLIILFFVLSTPIIENFYTLSKGEPLQLLLVMSSYYFYETGQRITKILFRFILFIASSLFILGGLMVKETTITLLPIFIVNTCILFVFKRYSTENQRESAIIYLFCITFSIVLYMLIRNYWGAPSLTDGTYTNMYMISFTSIFVSITRWATLLTHYFLYILPISIYFFICFYTKKMKLISNDFRLLEISIWSFFWLAILFPWEHAKAYYLLPFSLGTSIILGYSLFLNFRDKNLTKIHKLINIVLISITIFFFIITLPNYYTLGRTQLLYDEINNSLLMHIVNEVPKNSHLYHNIQNENEYIENIDLFLRNEYGRSDLVFNSVSLNNTLNNSQKIETFIVVPLIKNQPRLQVRAGIIEETQNAWNDQLFSNLSSKLLYKYAFVDSFHITNINLPVLLCSAIGKRGFCENPDPLIDTRIFQYGWEIYQIQ